MYCLAHITKIYRNYVIIGVHNKHAGIIFGDRLKIYLCKFEYSFCIQDILAGFSSFS